MGVLGLVTVLVSGFASAQGAPRPCDDVSDCLPGWVCEYPVGDCIMANGVCVTTPTCDTGEVCGCDGQTYSDACVAAAAGTVAESIGPCPVPPSCAAGTCVGNHFCVLLDGTCRDFGFLPCGTWDAWEPFGPEFGVCTQVPSGCTFEFDPVCGCDGRSYNNRCDAFQNRMSILHEGECGDCNSNTLPCSDPGEICVSTCGSCSTSTGLCREDPGACEDSCAPVCDCAGTWFRNECEAIVAGAGTDLLQPGDCGEVFAVQFASKSAITWSALETGGDEYNLYRSTAVGAGAHGPWDCIASAIQERPYGVGGPPAAGQVWFYVVTQVSSGIEGSLGYGGADCSPRTVSTPCPP